MYVCISWDVTVYSLSLGVSVDLVVINSSDEWSCCARMDMVLQWTKGAFNFYFSLLFNSFWSLL